MIDDPKVMTNEGEINRESEFTLCPINHRDSGREVVTARGAGGVVS